MTPQEFSLKKGSIKFEQNQIIIDDNAASNRVFMFVFAALWTFSGIMRIRAYNRTGDRFDLAFGVIFIILQVAIIIIYSRRSVDKDLSNNDVDSIQVRRELGSKYLHIKLKNGKVRRVDNLGLSAFAIETFVKNDFNRSVVPNPSAPV